MRKILFVGVVVVALIAGLFFFLNVPSNKQSIFNEAIYETKLPHSNCKKIVSDAEEIFKQPPTQKYEIVELAEDVTFDEVKDLVPLTTKNDLFCWTAAIPKKRKTVKKSIPIYNPPKDLVHLSEGEEIEEAFVSFLTNNQPYVDLMQIVVEAVHEFSTRPIILFGFDMENPYTKNNFSKLKFVKAKGAAHSVFFNKIKAIMLSRVKYGVLLEADSIPNWKVDDLFFIAKKHASGRYPILPRHPLDPHDQIGKMKEMNIPCKTMDYGHAHILFSYHNLQFLNDVHEQCIHGDFNGLNWDETALNVNLWRVGARKQACTYDPNRDTVHAYINQKGGVNGNTAKTNEIFDIMSRKPEIADNYYPSNAPTAFHLLHGGKAVTGSRKVFELLKANKGKPVYTDGNIWTNDMSHPAIRDCIIETSPSS